MKLEDAKVGQKVEYYPLIRRDGIKIGGFKTVIKTEPYNLGGSFVVTVEGKSGAIDIENLELILQ